MSRFGRFVARFRTPGAELRSIYYRPEAPAQHRNIRVVDRNGVGVARLVWKVCTPCRRGLICSISIMPDFQRQGLGRRLITRALHDGPQYRWATTGQSPQAKQFFPVIAAETGVALPEYGGCCSHMKEPGPVATPSPRRRRPLLDRHMH
jgi:hypothetical protein